MDPLSDSSTSSSDDEESSGVTALADLMWHKVVGKSSKKENPRQPSPSKSSSSPSNITPQPDFSFVLPSLTPAPEVSNTSNAKMSKMSNAKMSKMSKTRKEDPIIMQRMKKELNKLQIKKTPEVTDFQKKKAAKAEKGQWSRGKEGWGSMRMMEMTEERKQDLMVLNMRATVDPTRHYKHADLKTPKFFQIGTVQEDHYNFYHDRIPNKKRKRTLVDELMADHQFRKKLKKQYQEVQSTKSKGKAVFQTRAPRKIKRKK